MTEKKTGGWHNPASAANGRRGGRPKMAEGQKRVQKSVNLTPDVWGILARRRRPGESESDALERILRALPADNG